VDKNITPCISVILPVYNADLFIEEAINSILNQTVADFELIIVNDGSTDQTASKILLYTDPRIVYVDNEKNIGLIKTLNKAIRLSKGQFIARMDSDDVAMFDRFEKQLDFLRRTPEVGVCGSNVEVFGQWNFVTDLSYSTIDIEAEMLLKNPIFHPTVMLRREILEKNNIWYDENFKHAEDYQLWVELSKYAKIENLPNVLLKYRWHNNNISSTQTEVQSIKAPEIIAQKLTGILHPLHYTESEILWVATFLYIQSSTINKVNRREYRKLLIAFNYIYQNFICRGVTQKVFLKYSDQITRVLKANKTNFLQTFFFVLTSQALQLSIKKRLKFIFNLIIK